jgi:hypothetical protein
MGLKAVVLDLFYNVIDLFLGRVWPYDDDHGDPFLKQTLSTSKQFRIPRDNFLHFDIRNC